jgi:hypothetical protein
MLLMYINYKDINILVKIAICIKQLSRSAVEIIFEIIYFLDWK